MRVFGQPNMDGTVEVADDGTIRVPLAGAVHVAGLSPSQAALKVEAALKAGRFLVNPQVSLIMLKSHSQQVSVLGQVHAPGIYTVESKTTLLDVLALAGGETKGGADRIIILRARPNGTIERLSVNLEGLAEVGTAPRAAEITMKGGDRVYVPRAPVFYVDGEVHAPAQYRLDPGMTVLQAISAAGGPTNQGSIHRIRIRRRDRDGHYHTFSPKLTDRVRPNDVITVKERIF